MPEEFNAWILFRGLVDIILVNDVVSYIIFCAAYYQPVVGPISLSDAARFAGGIVMCAFNIWVKADAVRVIGQFSWYFLLEERDENTLFYKFH